MKHIKHNKNIAIAGVVGLVAVIALVVSLVYVFVIAERKTTLTVEEYVAQFCGEQGILTDNLDIDFIKQIRQQYDTVGKLRTQTYMETEQLRAVVPPKELQAYHNVNISLFQQFNDILKDQDPDMLADDVAGNRLLALAISKAYNDYGNDLAVAAGDLSTQTYTTLENGGCMTDFFAYLEGLAQVQEILDAEEESNL